MVREKDPLRVRSTAEAMQLVCQVLRQLSGIRENQSFVGRRQCREIPIDFRREAIHRFDRSTFRLRERLDAKLQATPARIVEKLNPRGRGRAQEFRDLPTDTLIECRRKCNARHIPTDNPVDSCEQ